MIYFCEKCRINFKESKDTLCSDCKLTSRERYLLFRQCIVCIEWYDDPYHKCEHVKPLRKYKKKKKKTWTYATTKRELEKPKEEYKPNLTLTVPMGFA